MCVRVAGNRWPVYADASVCIKEQRIPLEGNVSYRRGKGGDMGIFTTMGDGILISHSVVYNMVDEGVTYPNCISLGFLERRAVSSAGPTN